MYSAVIFATGFSLLSAGCETIARNGGGVYSRFVRKEDLIEYAGRDWDSIAALKRRRATGQKQQMTPAEAIALGDELRRHALSLHPDWPTAEQRKEDLAVHMRVSESLPSVDPKRCR